MDESSYVVDLSESRDTGLLLGTSSTRRKKAANHERGGGGLSPLYSTQSQLRGFAIDFSLNWSHLDFPLTLPMHDDPTS